MTQGNSRQSFLDTPFPAPIEFLYHRLTKALGYYRGGAKFL